MKVAWLVCLLFFSCTLAAKLKWYELNYSYKFDTYLKHYGKSYADVEEYNTRKNIFEANLNRILLHNKDVTKTWKEEINHLADWTPAELNSLHGYNKAWGYASKGKYARSAPPATVSLSAAPLPTFVDWRTQGVVTAVKDQGDCGSCWSFATAETIESHAAIKTGELWDLSEQQILDCTINPNDCGGTGGCEGGTVEVAIDTIAKLGGLSSEWTYSYLSHGGKDFPKCGFNATTTPPAVGVTSYVNLAVNQYLPLLTAVATLGPIAISVDASSWHFYASGVFNGCNQTNPDLDHAVQLVGYGTEGGQDYWLVRNSWTPAWGDAGYIKLFRTSATQCGIDLTPSDGDGCNGGPANVTVCGTCGILFDTVYPLIA